MKGKKGDVEGKWEERKKKRKGRKEWRVKGI